MCGKTNRWLQWVLVAVVATLFGVLSLSAHVSAAAGINSQISFEGKVVTANGVNVPDGTYNMEFKIYQDGTSTGSGTLKWTEDRFVSNSTGVTVTGGTFQVNLGSVTAFGNNIDWNQSTLWLSMNVGGTGSTASWDGEMTPYIRLTAVPYALNAGTVGGLSANQLVQLSPSTQQSGTINVSGAASVGSLSVGSTSVVNTSGLLQTGAVSGSYTGITGLGTITVGTWNASTLNAAYGGTGQSAYTVGDLLYASSSTSLSKLSDVATGSCLISGGTGTAPTWGSCGSSTGATAALSNLANVAINTSLLPGTSNAIDAGSSSLAFRSGYFATSVITPTLQSASGNLAIDTGGSATLSLGASNATTINIGPTGSTATATTTNIGSTTGAAQDINIGGTGASGGSNANTVTSVQGGAGVLMVSNTGTVVQSTTNSTTAFQIQNAAGAPVLLVDSTTSNVIYNPGFEISGSPAPWSAVGSTTLSKNTAKANTYHGQSSMSVSTPATANTGAQVTSSSSPNGFTQTVAAGTYTISFYAMLGSGTAFIPTVTPYDGTARSCTVSGSTIVTTGFQRYYCTFTTTSNLQYIQITQPNASATVFYIDSVQLIGGSVPTAYGVGAIQLRGVINSPLALQSASNSTTAFMVQDASSVSAVQVDTLNGRDYFYGTSINGSSLTFSSATSAAVTSANGQNLALNTGTAGGTITTNAGTIQRTTSGGATTTLDLNDSSNTTLKLYNSGSGVANLWLYGGGIYTGAAGSTGTLRLDNGGNLSNIGTISSTGLATIAGNLQVGSQTANTNSYLAVLNNYSNTTTEPTAVTGAMYYNSYMGQFRCGVAGAWVSCGGMTIANTATASCTLTTTATACVPNNYFTGTAPTIPANYCSPGRAIHVIVNGTYTQTTTTAQSLAVSIRLAGTVIGVANSASTAAAAVSTGQAWNVDFWITCNSSTTVTGEGTLRVASNAAGTSFNQSGMAGTSTTTVTNSNAQAIAPYVNWGAATSGNTATIQQFIVQAE